MKTLLRLGALVCALACVSPAFGQAAAPVISPAAGTYASTQSVTVTDATSGADIFCTTDGSAPTPESPKYTGPLTVSANTTVKCIAAKAGVIRNNIQNDSPSASGTYWKAADFSDAGGSGTPTGVVHQSGIASPSLSGASMKFGFTGQTGKQTNVLFAVSGGFGKCDSCTYHKYDYYVYDDPVTCTANATDEQDDYNFMASLGLRNMDGGQARRVSSGGNPPGWDYGGNSNVHWTYSGAAFTLSCGTWHHIQRAEHIVPAELTSKPCVDFNGVHWACIYQDYWALDGTKYTNSGAAWTFPMNALPGGWSSVNGVQHQGDVSSAGGQWLEYIDNASFVSYFPASSTTSNAYVITGGTGTPTAATPAIAPAGGFVSGTQTVTMTDATSGAAIHYTTDGTNPTCSSSTYATPLSITVPTTVKALACATGYTNSAIASQVYTYSGSGGITPAPSMSPAGGSYTATQFVSLSDAQSGSVIYFTTDGTTPTTSSAVYSVPLSVTATATIKAMAAAPGLTNSAVVSQTYTIVTTLTADTPTFTPVGGNYNGTQSVTIADAVSGATIYYTTDGSTPTTSSTVYTTAITVSSTTTLKAIAVATGYNNSAVGAAIYNIGCGLPPLVTGNIDPTQTKPSARQGAGPMFQMAAGSFVNGDILNYDCNGNAIDSGTLLSGLATKAGVQQQSYTYAADTGTANAYAVTLSPAPTIMAGSVVRFKAANTNTGASTLAVNGGSATAIKKGGSAALTGAEISTGQITEVVYDGTNWQMIGASASSSPLTTKGDLYGHSTSDTRVAVGSDGTFLQADSTQSAGVNWVNSVLVYKGAWSSGGSYLIGNVVSYSGTLYLRLTNGGGGGGSPTLVQSAALASTVRSLAFTSNVTSGHLLVIAFADEGTVDPSTVTDTLGTSFTKADAETGQSNNLAIYYGIAPSSGADTISFTSGGGWPKLTISEIANVNASVNVAAHGYNTVSVTTTVANTFIYTGVGGFHSGDVFTITSPFAITAQANGHDAIGGGYYLASSAGTYSPGWSNDGNSPEVAVAFTTGVPSPNVDPTNWMAF